MMWPWTARALVIAAEKRTASAESRAIASDPCLADYMEQARTIANIEENERKSLREDNKLLIDRIVQMSGQPPIFHPVPTPATPPVEPKPAAPSSIPAPETRTSFSDVHKAAREAIKSGKLNILDTQGKI